MATFERGGRVHGRINGFRGTIAAADAEAAMGQVGWDGHAGLAWVPLEVLEADPPLAAVVEPPPPPRDPRLVPTGCLLLVAGAGEGCDDTIGCNQRWHWLGTHRKQEAHGRAVEALEGIERTRVKGALLLRVEDYEEIDLDDVDWA